MDVVSSLASKRARCERADKAIMADSTVEEPHIPARGEGDDWGKFRKQSP
jgi:hypothetical protein